MPLCSNSTQSLMTTSTLCCIRHNPRYLGGKAAPTFRFVLLLLQEAECGELLANSFITTDENNSGYRIFIKGGPPIIINRFLTRSFKYCLSIIAAPARFILFLSPCPSCQCLSSCVLSPALLPHSQTPVLTIFPSGSNGTETPSPIHNVRKKCVMSVSMDVCMF